MSVAIPIGASVTAAERPMLVAAAEQLSECLADPGEPGWPIHLRFVEDNTAPPPILIATMRGAMENRETIAHVAARLAAWRAAGARAVFLCTLLRHVADPPERALLMSRLRMLNLRAVELSHECGLAVIDVDRVLALFGAVPLQTDWRLGGLIAPEVAAHVIASALLADGLDDWVDAARQARAIARHGDIHAIAGIVDRRLRARAGAATPAA